MVAPALHTGGLGWAAFPVTSSLFPSFLRKGKLDRGQRPGFRAGLCGPGLSGAGGKARWALSRWALPRPHRPSLSLSSRADDTACGRPSPTANLTGVVRTAPGAGGTRSPAASSRLVLSPCSGAVLMTPVRAVHCLLAPSPPSNAPRLPLPSSTPAHCPPAGHTPLQTCLQTPRLARPPSSYAWWGLPDLWALLHASLGSSAHQVPTRAPSSDRALGGPDLLPTLSPVPDPSGTPVLPAWPGPGSARHPCLCPLGLRPPPPSAPSARPGEHTGVRVWLETCPLTLGPSPVGAPLLWRACPARPATSLCPRSRGAPGTCRCVAMVSRRRRQQDCPALRSCGLGREAGGLQHPGLLLGRRGGPAVTASGVSQED